MPRAIRQRLHKNAWRHHASSCLLLLAYTSATIGLPVGRLSADAHSGCRCSSELQSSGSCCCQKRTLQPGLTSPARSCCVKSTVDDSDQSVGSSGISVADPAPPIGSCCRRPASPTETPVTCKSPTAEHPSLSQCGCGSEVPPNGLLANTDPRLVESQPHVTHDHPTTSAWQGRPAMLSGRSLAPETPPPETTVA